MSANHQMKMVDEGIKKIREERAELDELRASLQKREDELSQREREADSRFSVEQKEFLDKEIEDLTAEIKRLRTERDSSIENFGGEIAKIHDEKTAESASHVKQLQGEINFLLKGKVELEEEIDVLKEQISSMEEKAKIEQNRIIDEKEVLLSRTRAEREANLKEINLAHSVAVAELDREKKELENDIEALQQAKTIEWNKTEAEISRYKTAQIAELDAKREQILAEIEKEKESMTNALLSAERKQRSEISEEKLEWDRQILKYQTEKQKILDEIKIHEYEYEKLKSESLLHFEKSRADEEKALKANRAEALVKLEEEQAAITLEFKLKTAEEKNRARDKITALEKDAAENEAKLSALVSEINGLEVKFERQRAENELTLETLRQEKLREIDEQRVARLQEIESLRQVRISALETAYLEKSRGFEQTKNDRLDECRKEIQAAEEELRAVTQNKIKIEKQIEALNIDAVKILEENEALQKSGAIERKLELEKMANAHLAEAEKICASRIADANSRAKEIEEKAGAEEEKISAKIAEGTETLLELRRAITAQKLELEREKTKKLEEIEQATIESMEVHSKMQLTKISEIETQLEAYKKERMESIQNDIARQSNKKYKDLDELVTLNDDYNKRVIALQERELALNITDRSD